MSITIEVTAKCESMTQRGTKCTKEAKVYEPGRFGGYCDPVVVNGPLPGNRLYDARHNSIPTGFMCNSHSREGLAAANRRWMANHNRPNRR